MRATEQLLNERISFDLTRQDRVMSTNIRGLRFDETDEAMSARQLTESLHGLAKFLQLQFSDLQALNASTYTALNLSEAIYFYRRVRLEVAERLNAWNEFVAQLVQIRFESIDSVASKQWKRDQQVRWKDQVLADAEIVPIGLPTDLTTGQELARIHGAKSMFLAEQSGKMLQEIPKLICEQLISLVAAEVVGLVYWPAEDICIFSRNERVFQFKTRTEFRRNTTDTPTKRMVEISRRLGADVDQRLVRTVEHLIDAQEKRLDDPTVIVPRHLQKMAKSIPTWIADAVKVIEGTLVREIVVERSVADRRFVVMSSESVILYEDRELEDYDPALVLGPFVLAGWGESDMRTEVYRRALNDNSSHLTNKTRLPWNKLAGMLLLPIATLLAMTGNVVWGVLIPAALACLSAYLLGRPFEKLQELESSRKVGNNERASAIAMLISVLSVASGFAVSLSWPLVAMAGFLFSAMLIVLYLNETVDWNIVTQK